MSFNPFTPFRMEYKWPDMHIFRIFLQRSRSGIRDFQIFSQRSRSQNRDLEIPQRLRSKSIRIEIDQGLICVKEKIFRKIGFCFKDHRNFPPWCRKDVATTSKIFPAIAASISKMSVPIMKKRSWIFKNTPTICFPIFEGVVEDEGSHFF